ncbi:MAG TPA: EpsI family protein [Candidatus Acidoferrales bacterium]|nr:EpsI family protein [Candidatus Acidoferrales bacterium]
MKATVDLPAWRARLQPVLLVQFALLASLYLALYGPLFDELAREWYEHPSFSYGFLVPAIAAYLVWDRRRLLGSLPIEANPWTSLLLFGAVVIGLLGRAVEDSFVMRAGMILALAALVYLLLGRRFMRALLFPLAYLFLMIPAPYAFVKTLSYYLRLFDAVLAAGMLRLIGIPVYRDSYFLQLPGMNLEVADVCSGVSSLFTLFALAALYAYFLPAGAAARLCVVASAAPFAVVVNLFRIVLTCALAYYFGPAMLESFFHAFSGTLTFLLSLVLVVGFGEALRRRGAVVEREVAPAAPETRTADSLKLLSPSFLLALLILGLGYAGNIFLESRRSVALAGDLQVAAADLGFEEANGAGWSGAYSDANAEEALSRIYRAPDGGMVELYVGFRGQQSAESRLRSPRLYFPDGWNYEAIETKSFRLSPAESVRATAMLTRKGSSRRLVVFWYQVGGESLSDEVQYRWRLIRNSILQGRTDGAVVRIATAVREGEPPENAQARIAGVVERVYPALRRILPA